jgi:hypothetical protein
MNFDTMKDVTMIEFGFLKNNLMFLLYNENSPLTVGCYLVHLGATNLDEDVKISSEDDCVHNITLHPEDDEFFMADCFISVTRVMSTITVATVCVSFFVWLTR